MILYRGILFPLLPICIFTPLFLIVKVFAPTELKLLFIEFFIPSIAVRIPTKAAIPTAMIRTVKIVRNNWLLTVESAIIIFSFKNDFKLIFSF